MKNFLRRMGRLRLVIVVGLLLLGFSSNGQNNPLSPFDTQRERGLDFEDQNQLDSAVACYKRAEQIAIASKDKSNEVVILNDLGIVHRKISDYIACKNYYQRASEIALKSHDTEMLEMSLHGLGSLYEQTGDYDDAVACYLRTIQLTQERGDKEGVIITRQNLAKTYMHLSFKDASIKEIETALQGARLLKNDSLSANVLHDYAEILIHFKDYAVALNKMESALHTYEKIGYDRYIGSSLVYLGDIYSKINQTEHAFSSFEKALIYSEKMDGDVLADLYVKIGDYYQSKNNLPIAKIYFEKAYKQAHENTYKAIEQTASWRLYQVYRQQDKADQALSYLEQASALKDELYNAEKTGRVAELQLQFDNEKQLKALHAMQLRQNRYTFLFSILALLGIIGALIYHARVKSRNTQLLEQKNSEIANQNRQLADHINVLKQYSYAAAHDLKEPLRTITSFVTLLEKRYVKDIEAPEAKEYMQFIGNSARRMNLLLTDLLEYNSILSQEAGTESVQPIELIYEVWDSLSALAEEKNARLILPSAIPGLKMNRFHFMQLIQNLVSNGLKFTHGKSAEIKIGFEVRDNSFILSVTDNGIGIDEQYKEKIFQMFYRLNDLKDAEGTGIGLTIVKNIAEKYKGRIWFNSVAGVGTTFHVSLPIHLIDAVTEIAPKAPVFSRSVAAAATL
jgi:signal transduction histidine kinase